MSAPTETTPLLFVRSMTVRRAGKSVEDFADALPPDAARAALSEQGHTLCEYLRPAGRTKLYLDYDALEEAEPSPDGLLRHKLKVVGASNQILEEVGQGSFVVASRHGPKGDKHKVSFRVFFLGFSVSYPDIPKLIRLHGQDKLWDTAPYKPADQLLAAVMGRKGRGDDRVLRPEPEFAGSDLLDFTAQHLGDGWEHLDIAGFVGAAEAGLERRGDERAEAPPGQPGTPCDPEFVSDILDAMKDDRADDYSSWIRIGIALKRGGYGMGMWDDFSKRSGKYDAGEVERVWDGMDVSEREGAVGVGSLVEMAREDDPLKARLALEEKKNRDAVRKSDVNRVAALQLLSEKLPEHFPQSITDATVAADGRSLTITAGDNVAVVSDILDVSIAGAFVGNLLTDTELDIGPLTWLHKFVPSDATRFRFDKVSRDTTTLTSVVNGANAGLKLTDTGNGKPVVDVNVPGKTSQVVSSQKKIKDLSEVMRQAIKLKAWQELRAIHDAMFCGAIVNNGVQNFVLAELDDKNREFVECRDLLFKRAKELKIRKADGKIWRQVQGCPLAFAPYLTGPDEDVHMTYNQYINEALADNETFNANPRRLTELLSYLEGYTNIHQLPEFTTARDLLSFSNGVLRLSTGEFTPYTNDLSEFQGRACRHHINQTWTGDVTTPLMDRILDHQFDKDVAWLLFALIGRCFFRVGQLDKWQVFPYIKGTGETGKSVVLAVVSALFRDGTVGNLATKREEVFGMDNIADKDLVIGRDMPKKLSGVLQQETLQSMVTGEGMEIARKGGKACNIKWTAPIIITSNHFTDYESTGGNTARRFVTICFNNPVTNPDYSLEDRILAQELPNIVARSLHCYRQLRERIRTEGIPFWSAVPPQVLAWKSSMTAATNQVHRFLAMDDDERGCRIIRKEGHVTWVQDLAYAMEAICGPKTFHKDTAVLVSFGFSCNPEGKRPNVCKSCKQIAKKGCCPAYGAKNRCTKDVIYGMELIFESD